MDDSKLDVWAIYRDPEHVLDALKIILDKKDEIIKNGPLTLFVNCVSSLYVNEKRVRRYMDTLICSREADIALCLSSARYYDPDLGEISATPEDIARFLEKHGIPYEIVTGTPQKDDVDDLSIPEVWMVRERFVLEDSLKESIEKGCKECVVYPKTNAKLSMGYYLDDGSYYEVWGLHYKGLIETSNSWTLLINENDPRNFTIEDAIEIIKEKGLSYTEGEEPNYGNVSKRI
jgi:hypothetical protein